jgi:hypothetical protein
MNHITSVLGPGAALLLAAACVSGEQGAVR